MINDFILPKDIGKLRFLPNEYIKKQISKKDIIRFKRKQKLERLFKDEI